MNLPAVGGPAPSAPGRAAVLIAVAAVGGAALVTQLVLLRELGSAFGGDERTLGAGLGAWLLLGGGGAALGGARRRRPPGAPSLAGAWLGAALLALAVLAPATVFAGRLLAPRVFSPGSAPGFAPLLGAVLVWFAPFAGLQGFALSRAAAALGRDGASGAPRAYLADTLGALGAGALYAAWWVDVTTHFTAVLIAAVGLALGALGLGARGHRRGLVAGAVVVVAVAAALGFGVDLERATLAVARPGATVREVVYSAHGRLAVLERGGRRELERDGSWLAASDDPSRAQTAALVAMEARPDLRRVLVVGGAAAGTARELLRRGAVDVDVLEPDAAAADTVRRWFPEALLDPRIHLNVADPRRFVDTVARTPTGPRYDAVVYDLSAPVTLAQNRLFTAEHLASVARVLGPRGVLVVPMGQYENHVGARLAAVLAIERATLATVFDAVQLVPLGEVWFVASPAPLGADLTARYARAELSGTALAPSEVAAALAPDRVAAVTRAAAAAARVNRDLAPSLVAAVAAHGRERYPRLVVAVPVGLALLLVVALARSGAVGTAVAAAGFGGGALQALLLFGYSLVRGDLFRELALLVTAFFAGAALGLHAAERAAARRPAGFPYVLLALAALVASVPAVLVRLVPWTASPATVLAFVVASLVGGALVGSALPLAARCRERGAPPTAGRLFAADLLGGAGGAAVVGGWVVPAIGVPSASFVVAAAVLLGAVAAWIAARRS